MKKYKGTIFRVTILLWISSVIVIFALPPYSQNPIYHDPLHACLLLVTLLVTSFINAVCFAYGKMKNDKGQSPSVLRALALSLSLAVIVLVGIFWIFF